MPTECGAQSIEVLVLTQMEAGYRVSSGSLVDKAVVTVLTCHHCQATDTLTYLAFTKPGSILAYTVCAHCGDTQEF